MAESDLSEFLAGNDHPRENPSRDSTGAPGGRDPSSSEGHQAGEAGHATGTVPLGNRFQIFADRPVPALNGATSLAFDARDNRDPNALVFALVCHRELPPRIDITQSLRGIDQAWLTAPLDYGLVLWGNPPAHRHAFVFDKPDGGRVVNKPGDRITPLSEDRAVRVFLQPALNTLKELKVRRVSHGSINALNLYHGEGPESPMRIGECVSAPPGYSQPALYEPIERGMADPAGRRCRVGDRRSLCPGCDPCLPLDGARSRGRSQGSGIDPRQRSRWAVSRRWLTIGACLWA